jgi:enamidase
MTLAIVNVGDSHDGGPAGAPLAGDALVCANGRVDWVGSSADVTPGDHEVVVDAAGATVLPGLIDSHVHITFGDYTPRQQTVGYLDSYLHGGTTTAISASEVHVPGRPTDRIGVKALAIAAQRCFTDYRPAGMRVHAGAVILEPDLRDDDFVELREAGVWMAKAGFGAFPSARAYAPLVDAAKSAGLLVMCHTGGGSIGGSQPKIGAEDLLLIRPDVAGHVNGGPTALSDEENAELVRNGRDIALQLVLAGNLRSAIHLSTLALEQDDFHRLLIATDTPTGTGVVPLGLLHVMSELASLGPLSPRQAVSAATGNVAAVYGLETGRLGVGSPADLLIVDAPVGSSAEGALAALGIGDLPSVACVVTDGILRLIRSRNTPAPHRPVRARRSAPPEPMASLTAAERKEAWT